MSEIVRTNLRYQSGANMRLLWPSLFSASLAPSIAASLTLAKASWQNCRPSSLKSSGSASRALKVSIKPLRRLVEDDPDSKLLSLGLSLSIWLDVLMLLSTYLDDLAPL